MQDFDYVSASSIEEVVSVLSKSPDARVLSGGTDLIVQLREGRKRAPVVVDIKRVPEANVLSYDPAVGLRLGAAVPCWQIACHEQVAAVYPGLVDGIALIGGTQIQGRATVGGNLCNASPAADSIPALIVHEAECEVVGPQGARLIKAEAFCTGPGRNALREGEFLVAMLLPPPPRGFGAAYLRFIPRNEMDIAVVGAGASLVLKGDGTIDRARISLGAVAPTPLLVEAAGDSLRGKRPTDENLRAAALIARDAARPITDMRGSAAQRTTLSAVLARRALEAAVKRAEQAR